MSKLNSWSPLPSEWERVNVVQLKGGQQRRSAINNKWFKMTPSPPLTSSCFTSRWNWLQLTNSCNRLQSDTTDFPLSLNIKSKHLIDFTITHLKPQLRALTDHYCHYTVSAIIKPLKLKTPFTDTTCQDASHKHQPQKYTICALLTQKQHSTHTRLCLVSLFMSVPLYSQNSLQNWQDTDKNTHRRTHTHRNRDAQVESLFVQKKCQKS